MEIACLVLFSLIIYAKTITYGLTIDDQQRFNRLVKPEKVGDKYKVLPGEKPPSFWVGFWTSLHTSGRYLFNVKIEHISNVVIHTINTVLVYLAFGGTSVSLFTACLFCVYPMNDQVAVWMNGKRYGISTMLVLLAWWLKPAGIILYPFTALWQSCAFPLPIMFVTTKWWYLAFITPIFLFVWNKKILRWIDGKKSSVPTPSLFKFGVHKLVIGTKTFGYYFWNMVIPTRIQFLHTFIDTYGFSNKLNKEVETPDYDFWKGVCAFVVYGLILISTYQTQAFIGFFWYGLFIIQWCNFGPMMHQYIANRYVYLPSIGFLYGIVSCIVSYIPSPYSMYAIIALLTYYTTRTVLHIRMYRSLEDTTKYGITEEPNQVRMLANTAANHLKNNTFIYAIFYAAEGLRIDPNSFQLNMIMANSLCAFGRPDIAKLHVEKAKENHTEEAIEIQKVYVKQIEDIIDNMMQQIKPKQPQDLGVFRDIRK